MQRLIAGLLVVLVLLVGQVHAQTCMSAIPASTPTSRFTDNIDGTVTDVASGLTWKRCAEGQNWDGAVCAGTAGLYNWQQALQQAKNLNTNGGYAGYSDWYIPNIKELDSIIERRCERPAINETVFTDTPSESFWSASPSAGRSDFAWQMGFAYGYDKAYLKSEGQHVRLVRGGQYHYALKIQPFLTVPISGDKRIKEKYISAVVDHHLIPTKERPTGYNCNSSSSGCSDTDGALLVTAFDGSIGDAQYDNNCAPPGYSQDLSGTAFTFNGAINYIGVSCKPPSPLNNTAYLNYDGHPGTDFAYGIGRPILAAADGTLEIPQVDAINNVLHSQSPQNYKSPHEEYNTLRILHDNGLETWYLHAKAGSECIGFETCPDWPNSPGTPPTQGQQIKVKAGQKIAEVGNTGTPGAHLHFEVRVTATGQVVDPFGCTASVTAADPNGCVGFLWKNMYSMPWLPLLLDEHAPTDANGSGMVAVTMQTSMGIITLELDDNKAPLTVANFVKYAKDGFYDNTIFHRVIPDFVIQGGGFTPDLTKKPTNTPIMNEADNGLKNVTGSIAMARTSDPHSATSQFFINLEDNTFLDYTAPTSSGWGYAVFGKVTDGMDVVRAIETVPTGSESIHQDVPLEDVVIEEVKVVE